jgi:hypothetical protein
MIGATALIGVGLPGEGRNSWDEFWTVTESFAVSTLTSSALKLGIARSRPSYGTGSFPSGHATLAFTGATLIDRNSSVFLGAPAYALASFTGFERVEAGRHYPSDVLAGAAVGTLSAALIDALHWGSGPGTGGIAGHSVACSVDVQSLHEFLLEVIVGF